MIIKWSGLKANIIKIWSEPTIRDESETILVSKSQTFITNRNVQELFSDLWIVISNIY